MTQFPEDFDRTLAEFCQEFGLHLSTESQGEEVRSISIVDDQSSSYQVWLERSESGWTVNVWDRESRRQGFAAQHDLPRALRLAYRELETWIAEKGHTRSLA